jgi:hypothetical protein
MLLLTAALNERIATVPQNEKQNSQQRAPFNIHRIQGMKRMPRKTMVFKMEVLMMVVMMIEVMKWRCDAGCGLWREFARDGEILEMDDKDHADADEGDETGEKALMEFLGK